MDRRRCLYPGCSVMVVFRHGGRDLVIHHGRDISALDGSDPYGTAWLDRLHAVPQDLRDDWSEHATMMRGG